jgi:hypothetical protein
MPYALIGQSLAEALSQVQKLVQQFCGGGGAAAGAFVVGRSAASAKPTNPTVAARTRPKRVIFVPTPRGGVTLGEFLIWGVYEFRFIKPIAKSTAVRRGAGASRSLARARAASRARAENEMRRVGEGRVFRRRASIRAIRGAVKLNAPLPGDPASTGRVDPVKDIS